MLNQTSIENKIKIACYKIYNRRIQTHLLTSNLPLNEIHDFIYKNRIIGLLPELSSSNYKKDYLLYVNNVKRSLKIVKQCLGREPFIVIKTFSSYPHITSDVDIVVKNKTIAYEVTRKVSQLHLPIAIDINATVSWTPTDEISTDFIWNNVRYSTFQGEKYLCPNPDLDLLIRIGHIPFELAEIRLGELLHIFNQMKGSNLMKLSEEAKKMGWEKTYKYMVDLLNNLHKHLFLPHGSFIRFPYKMSYWSLFQAMVEKKAWYKIWGARYILIDRLNL